MTRAKRRMLPAGRVMATVSPAMPTNPETRAALETMLAQAAQQLTETEADSLHLQGWAMVQLTGDPAFRATVLPATSVQVRAATAMSQHPEIRPLAMEPPEMLAFNRQMLAEMQQAMGIPARLLRNRCR